ncbi:MAG TPA: hypothetical protein VMZ28_08710 [Kofleriaceae bacterium]|nr:hypothetical protein [Kofleriaceae bacterium]
MCAPPVATYTAEVRAGKGTCDEDLLLAQLLPLEDVVIDDGASCGPLVVATYGFADGCDGTAELSVDLTGDELTDGRVDVVATACPGECTHAIPVDLTLVGGRP